MKKSLKKPMIAFFVVSLVFVVAWLVFFCLLGLLVEGHAFDFNYFVNEYLMKEGTGKIALLIDLFSGKFGFAPDAEHPNFWVSYVGIGVTALTVVMIVVGIIVAIKRKRAGYIGYLPVVLLSGFAVVDFVACFDACYKPYFDFGSEAIQKLSVTNYIFNHACMWTGVLAFVFMFVCYVIGLLHAKEFAAAKGVAPVEETATPTEETVAPAEDVNEAFATAAAADNEVAVETPVQEETPVENYNSMADFVAEPEEMVAQPEEIVVEEVPEQPGDPNAVTSMNKDDLTSLLRDVVRDIVRDEIARNKATAEEERPSCHRDHEHSIVGATFGGPLVVQYFNGGINGQSDSHPAPAPQVAPAPAPVAPAPAPKKEAPVAPKKEDKKEETPVVVAPAPVNIEVNAAPAVVQEAVDPAKEYERIPFTERMIHAEKEMQDNYNEIKNELLSYGVNFRVSNSGDTFRLHRKTYAKITIAGKSLKVYFALDPKDYADSKMPIGDASNKASYAEIPLIFKVKSGLSVRRCKDLIHDAMAKDGIEQGEVAKTNWVKELKAGNK